jgi:hypothetical protein
MSQSSYEGEQKGTMRENKSSGCEAEKDTLLERLLGGTLCKRACAYQPVAALVRLVSASP